MARHTGIQQIVKLSQGAVSPDSPVRLLRYHAAVERKIRRNPGWRIPSLRPNLFMQGLLAFREMIVGQGKFFAPVGDAKVRVIDGRDIAAAAAAALTEAGRRGETYDLQPHRNRRLAQALSHREMAERLSEALGRRIEFVDVLPETMREKLIWAGVPVWQADSLIEDYAHDSRAEAADVAPEFKRPREIRRAPF